MFKEALDYGINIIIPMNIARQEKFIGLKQWAHYLFLSSILLTLSIILFKKQKEWSTRISSPFLFFLKLFPVLFSSWSFWSCQLTTLLKMPYFTLEDALDLLHYFKKTTE